MLQQESTYNKKGINQLVFGGVLVLQKHETTVHSILRGKKGNTKAIFTHALVSKNVLLVSLCVCW